MLHDSSMSSEKLSQPESETQSLKRKYDDVDILVTELRSGLRCHAEGSDKHMKFFLKFCCQAPR